MNTEIETVGSWIKTTGLLLGGVDGLTPIEALAAFKADDMEYNPTYIAIDVTILNDMTFVICNYNYVPTFWNSGCVTSFSKAERAAINENTIMTEKLFDAILLTSQRIVDKNRHYRFSHLM
jgi:hypothetical protein